MPWSWPLRRTPTPGISRAHIPPLFIACTHVDGEVLGDGHDGPDDLAPGPADEDDPGHVRLVDGHLVEGLSVPDVGVLLQGAYDA